MESIPTPPASPDHGMEDTHKALLHSLDVLMERYLHLLDLYRTSQLKLVEMLSSVGLEPIQ